jgi:hypothetical protein
MSRIGSTAAIACARQPPFCDCASFQRRNEFGASSASATFAADSSCCFSANARICANPSANVPGQAGVSVSAAALSPPSVLSPVP